MPRYHKIGRKFFKTSSQDNRCHHRHPGFEKIYERLGVAELQQDLLRQTPLKVCRLVWIAVDEADRAPTILQLADIRKSFVQFLVPRSKLGLSKFKVGVGVDDRVGCFIRCSWDSHWLAMSDDVQR